MNPRTPSAAPHARPDELACLHVLRRVALESVEGLLEPCPVRELEPGETLLSAGQSNRTMFMLLSGRLSVHLDAPTTSPVAVLDAGQTVGEISLLDDSPASAWVVAQERSRLLAVDEQTFWRLVAASHQFASNLLFLLAQRMRANNSRFAASVRERARLERDATVDALTGVHNRRWLEDNLVRLVQRHRAASLPLSVVMLDVDHFKKLNDGHGHRVGDRVLSLVGTRLVECVRPTDLSARYGGEEFVVILPSSDLASSARVAERIRNTLARAHVPTDGGTPLPSITVSLGVAELVADETPSDLVARADGALYRAKHAGRNRVETAAAGDAPRVRA